MANNFYHIGLVMSASGPNDNQHEEMLRRIKALTSVMTADMGIIFWVPGYDKQSPETLWPITLKKLKVLEKVQIEHLNRNLTVPQYFHEMREYDEVWCLPAKGQARLTKCRVSMLYYMSQELEHASTARVFKWIPHWVGEDKLTKGK